MRQCSNDEPTKPLMHHRSALRSLFQKLANRFQGRCQVVCIGLGKPQAPSRRCCSKYPRLVKKLCRQRISRRRCIREWP